MPCIKEVVNIKCQHCRSEIQDDQSTSGESAAVGAYSPAMIGGAVDSQGNAWGPNAGNSGSSPLDLGISFNKFNLDANSTGVDIGIGVYNRDLQFSNLQWVQTIEEKYNGITSQYVDGFNVPFYYTTDQLLNHTNIDGFSIEVDDQPQKPRGAEGLNWMAQISLVGQDSTGAYVSVFTMSYGFIIKNGQADPVSPQSAIPNPFQTNTINSLPHN